MVNLHGGSHVLFVLVLGLVVGKRLHFAALVVEVEPELILLSSQLESLIAPVFDVKFDKRVVLELVRVDLVSGGLARLHVSHGV